MPIDYKQYHPEWKTKIRPDILERDNHCCKICGVRNSSIIHRYGKGMEEWHYWPQGMESEAWSLDGLKSTKIVLTIAHLDQDKTNNDYENLAALCQKCHLALDARHHSQNRRKTLSKNKKQIPLFPL